MDFNRWWAANVSGQNEVEVGVFNNVSREAMLADDESWGGPQEGGHRLGGIPGAEGPIVQSV